MQITNYIQLTIGENQNTGEHLHSYGITLYITRFQIRESQES